MNYRSIRAIPSGLEPALNAVLRELKENVEVLTGQRGDTASTSSSATTVTTALGTNIFYIDAYANLSTAITSIGTAVGDLIINKQIIVGSTLTVPSNVHLGFIGQGSLYLSTGITVTIAGAWVFEPPLKQIFYGPGSIAFSLTTTVYAEWWGAAGDGTTDDTTALSSAVSSGSVVELQPNATYLISHIAKTGNVVLRGDIGNPPIVKHKAAASDDMIDITGDLQVSGVKFDGNRANQTGRHKLIDVAGSFIDIRQCLFTGSVNRAISCTASGVVKVLDNRFLDMAEHGGTTGQTSLAGYITSNAAVQIWIQGNHVIHGTPSDVDSAPGGFQLSGTALSAEISGNYFKNIGQRKANNYIGCIDLYTDCDKTIVSNNRIDTYYYTALKLQNACRLVVTGNIIDGEADATADAAISIAYARSFGSSLSDIIVSKNILNLNGNVIGLYCQGSAVDPYTTERVLITENSIYNTAYAVDLRYGPKTVVLSHNIFTEVNYNVLLLHDMGDSLVTIKSSGNVYDKGSDTTGTHIYARSNVSNLRLHLMGDTFLGDAQNYYVSIRDADTIFIDGCDFSGSAGDRPIDILTVTNQKVTANNRGIDLTVSADSATLFPWETHYLDSSGGTRSATLEDGQYPGQQKLISMQTAGNNFTVSISHHETSDPESALFDAVDEYWLGVWTGTEWATVAATCTFP